MTKLKNVSRITSQIFAWHSLERALKFSLPDSSLSFLSLNFEHDINLRGDVLAASVAAIEKSTR